MPLIDTGYHHYEERHRGVWYRRYVIASVGLRACLANQWMKRLITTAWILSLAMVGLLFLIGQLLVEDSIAFTVLEGMGPAVQGLFNGLLSWLLDRPEVSVHATYNFLFFQFATKISFLSFIALAIAIPHLITTDLASRALLVYSSKAVNRFDYLVGKFGIAFGLLTILWLGPVCAAWLFGNLLAPDWNFFIHSRHALGNAVQYTAASMAVLSVLALGISATSAKEKSTGATWIAIWLLGSAFIPIGARTQLWLKNLSISHNIDQLALYFFDLRQDVELARSTIPIIGNLIDRFSRRSGDLFFMQDAALTGAAVAIGIMLLLAAVILWRKVKPE
jgi:ABC-2 type transport system permease protein